jgi:hypothetical protein
MFYGYANISQVKHALPYPALLYVTLCLYRKAPRSGQQLDIFQGDISGAAQKQLDFGNVGGHN